MVRRFFSLSFFFLYAVNTVCLQPALEIQLPELQQFARVEPEQVDFYHEKVSKELRKNKYVRVGVAVALLGATGFCGYKIFFGIPNKPTIVPPLEKTEGQECSNSELKKALEDAQETIRAQNKIMVDKGLMPDTSTWSGWLKSWGSFFGQQYLIIGLAQVVGGTLTPFSKYFKKMDTVVDGMIGKVFHDEDLNWFITSHTNIFDLLDQLEKPTLAMKDNPTEQHSFFVNTWQLSVQQLSSIVGFMQYKIAELKKTSIENAHRAQIIAGRVVNATNETSEQLQKLFEKSALAQSAVQIQKLRTALQQVFSEFALTEALTIY